MNSFSDEFTHSPGRPREQICVRHGFSLAVRKKINGRVLEGAFLDLRRILGSVSRAAEGCPGRPCEQICARLGISETVLKEINGQALEKAFLDFRRILGSVSKAAEGCRGLPWASK